MFLLDINLHTDTASGQLWYRPELVVFTWRFVCLILKKNATTDWKQRTTCFFMILVVFSVLDSFTVAMEFHCFSFFRKSGVIQGWSRFRSKLYTLNIMGNTLTAAVSSVMLYVPFLYNRQIHIGVYFMWVHTIVQNIYTTVLNSHVGSNYLLWLEKSSVWVTSVDIKSRDRDVFLQTTKWWYHNETMQKKNVTGSRSCVRCQCALHWYPISMVPYLIVPHPSCPPNSLTTNLIKNW